MDNDREPGVPEAEPPLAAPWRQLLVLVLMIAAAASVLGMFLVPHTSPWFWPLTGIAALTGLAAYVIPLPPSRPR